VDEQPIKEPMRALLPVIPLLLAACQAAPQEARLAAAPVAVVPEEPEVNWKERLDQAYLYVEHRGDYREFRVALQALVQRAEQAGIEPEGPLFGLFFDDPGAVPIEALRSRACLPVRSLPSQRNGLAADVLPRAVVVYTRVRGGREEVQRCYPKLLAFAERLGWETGPPIREVYLLGAGPIDAQSAPVTEVQVPWRRAD
jgi:effector-binding domain-containing protein